MLSNKHHLPGGRAAVQVAVRQVAVDPFRQQSGLTCHFTAQCTAPACFAAWKCRDHYLVFLKLCRSCLLLYRSLYDCKSDCQANTAPRNLIGGMTWKVAYYYYTLLQVYYIIQVG